MIVFVASLLLPVVLAGQLLALTLLWRRYRMPGAGWWLLATVLMFVCTVGQSLEEGGWRPMPLVAAVNLLGFLSALAELIAARLLMGQTLPSRRQMAWLVGLGVLWAGLAARQVEAYLWYRSTGVICLGLSEVAIAWSLFRVSRQGGSVGGYLAATGYALQVVMMPTYVLTGDYPWLRSVGMANAAFCLILIGWGLGMFVLERYQRALAQRTDGLAAEVASQTARMAAIEQQASLQATLLADQEGHATLGPLALDLAEELLSTVDVLRRTTLRLQSAGAPAEQLVLSERIESVLRELTVAAEGVLSTGRVTSRQATRVDGRQLLERLLADLVPSTVGVMKAWPTPQVWLTTDETVLGLAFHQAIRYLVGARSDVERISLIVEADDGVVVTLQQSLVAPQQVLPPTDTLSLKLSQLAVQRLGGHTEVIQVRTGTRLVMCFPG